MPIRKGRLARLSVFEHRFSEEKGFRTMEAVVLIVHLLIAVSLIGVVLVQKSEGGGLGIGSGGGGRHDVRARHGQPADPDHRVLAGPSC